MHPLNPLNFGTTGVAVQFYNGTSVVTGYIEKQVGTNRFVCTDGTNTAICALAPNSSIATTLSSNPTYCTIQVEPTDSDATGGSFTAHYKVGAATAVSSSGTHWNVGDSVALPSGAGALTVATVTAGQIATVTVGTAGDYTTLFSSPTTGTRAAGSGATLTAHYGLDSATLTAAGTGYAINDVLTLASTGSGTITVDTVNGSGVILTFHISAPGDVTSFASNPRTVTGGTGTGATFTVKYKLLSVASSGGSGYNVGDTLTFTSITATTPPTAHISTATSHAATAVTVDTAGSGITVAASGITTSTTTATFNLSYQLLSVASSGGSGYNVNDLLNFNGMVATSLPTAHISTATSGAATAVTVDTAGSGITTAATSINVGGATDYVMRIWDNRLRTVSGNTYFWTLKTSTNGSAILHTFS